MLDKTKWIRTCQECLHEQNDVEPPKTQSAYDKWAEHKCKKCKSSALDYGKHYSDNDFTI